MCCEKRPARRLPREDLLQLLLLLQLLPLPSPPPLAAVAADWERWSDTEWAPRPSVLVDLRTGFARVLRGQECGGVRRMELARRGWHVGRLRRVGNGWHHSSARVDQWRRFLFFFCYISVSAGSQQQQQQQQLTTVLPRCMCIVTQKLIIIIWSRCMICIAGARLCAKWSSNASEAIWIHNMIWHPETSPRVEIVIVRLFWLLLSHMWANKREEAALREGGREGGGGGVGGLIIVVLVVCARLLDPHSGIRVRMRLKCVKVVFFLWQWRAIAFTDRKHTKTKNNVKKQTLKTGIKMRITSGPLKSQPSKGNKQTNNNQGCLCICNENGTGRVSALDSSAARPHPRRVTRDPLAHKQLKRKHEERWSCFPSRASRAWNTFSRFIAVDSIISPWGTDLMGRQIDVWLVRKFYLTKVTFCVCTCEIRHHPWEEICQ